ncbi:exopolysaccharide biosynthesis polyprenyl glycosylphosphotransferase [Candidatus Saccharibacteria bacterium]|nr:exopolysaccharide biosynthesis polyprenyl glycosylphosphotransferase [Candidatus Saccharibacteria bacterium]
MKNNASLVYSFFLVVGDIAAIALSFVAAFVIRAASGPDVAHPMAGSEYAIIVASLLPLWVFMFGLLGLYNVSIYERRFAEVGRLLVGSFVGVLMMVFWDYISLQNIFPAKLVPIYGFGLAFVLLVSFRNIARIVRTGMFAYGVGLTRVAIIGNTPVTKELLASLANSRTSGYKIIGVIGYRKQLPESVAAFANFQAFLRAEPEDLHAIVQTELYANEAQNADILTYAQEHHVSYRFVPGNSELFVGNIDVDLFRGAIPVIQVHHTALFGWGRVLKRLTDVALGMLLLLVSLPLWLLSALLVKGTDPTGPVFYRAKRMSRFGNAVYVYKFRTMKQAYNNMSPEAGFSKMGRPELIKQYRQNGDQLANDPRISTVGRLLRASSLDELPQLWNVVRGDISLVGPRALDVEEIEKYDKKNLILSVKSGLTGLALVSGRHAISFDERRKLDLYYVQNWSFWLDLVILTKTVRVVLERLFRHGARYEQR